MVAQQLLAHLLEFVFLQEILNFLMADLLEVVFWQVWRYLLSEGEYALAVLRVHKPFTTPPLPQLLSPLVLLSERLTQVFVDPLHRHLVLEAVSLPETIGPLLTEGFLEVVLVIERLEVPEDFEGKLELLLGEVTGIVEDADDRVEFPQDFESGFLAIFPN